VRVPFSLESEHAIPACDAADFDIRGRMVVHGVSMQFIRFAGGPAITAQLLGFGYDVINPAAAILFVGAALMLLPGVLAQREGLRR